MFRLNPYCRGRLRCLLAIPLLRQQPPAPVDWASLGATCSNKTRQTYGSLYDARGNVTSRTVNGTSATLSYYGLDHLTRYDAGSNRQEQYVYDASGERVLRRSTSSGITSMTVYAFGLEEHLYDGTGVHQNQSDTYYYLLGGMLVGESTGTNTNMFPPMRWAASLRPSAPRPTLPQCRATRCTVPMAPRATSRAVWIPRRGSPGNITTVSPGWTTTGRATTIRWWDGSCQ